ncbi:MAG TPA: hypothetical protein VHH36_06425 [Candidatus Thermoplasmatota archaeon]|nr:hypothetical protein [Candidatus Thermoplasmatota archaeon]
MKTLLVAALLLTTTAVAFAPTAGAAHMGPRWHEYLEAALQGPKYVGPTVRSCLGNMPIECNPEYCGTLP